MIIDKKLFYKIQSTYFSDIPFNQTKEWMESTISDDHVSFFVNNLNEPEIVCWGKCFKRRFIGIHLIIDGITIKTDNEKKNS